MEKFHGSLSSTKTTIFKLFVYHLLYDISPTPELYGMIIAEMITNNSKCNLIVISLIYKYFINIVNL